MSAIRTTALGLTRIIFAAGDFFGTVAWDVLIKPGIKPPARVLHKLDIFPDTTKKLAEL